MDANANALNWFEIPAVDIDRATKFYNTIFGIELRLENMMGMDMASFPLDMGNGKVSGAVVKSPYHTPSADGTIVYLNANPDLSAVLDRVEANGGKIVMPKTTISPEIGSMAMFMDSEGNRVALHSQH